MRRIRNAFTLIELLIVVAIIGILAAIAVPNFINAQVRAKVSRARSDLKAISTAVEMYRLDNNAYPGGEEHWASGGFFWTAHSSRFVPLTTPVSYMSTIPLDPFQLPVSIELSDGRELGGYSNLFDGAYVYDDITRTGHTIDAYGKSYHYTVRSPGPGRSWTVAHPGVIYYAPSNGLHSLGIIAVLGPGGTMF